MCIRDRSSAPVLQLCSEASSAVKSAMGLIGSKMVALGLIALVPAAMGGGAKMVAILCEGRANVMNRRRWRRWKSNRKGKALHACILPTVSPFAKNIKQRPRSSPSFPRPRLRTAPRRRAAARPSPADVGSHHAEAKRRHEGRQKSPRTRTDRARPLRRRLQSHRKSTSSTRCWPASR